MRWIVICAQWPYSTSRMRRALRRQVAIFEASGEYPKGQPLKVLRQACETELDVGQMRRYDDDQEVLEALIEDTKMSWPQLRTLQAFTLNFNPAIEEAETIVARPETAGAVDLS